MAEQTNTPVAVVSEDAPATYLPLEADNDADSTLGSFSELASSTTSVGSSIMKHREENGRTYHAYKDGKYAFPNDDSEASRLDLQHHIHLLANDGKLATSPFEKGFAINRVLDVGTGTGIWAIDFADENPQAKVLGIDLSPIQPEFLPPNCSFEIDDVEEPWTYREKFEFIHSRIMTGSISNWPRFFEQAYEFTSPGGYIELTDQLCPVRCDDGTLPPNSALLKWSELLLESTLKVARGFDSAKYYGESLKAAGYIDVKLEIARWPMNPWAKDKKLKEIGLWQRENLLVGCSGISLALFTRILGWTPEEVEVFLVDVRKEMKDTKIHAYWDIYTWTARKPL